DVVEMDGASNNGVDNARSIIEEISYPPTTGRYKVYIIDEVHMLSPGAFNALLKTIEEPPAYAIFILATTEVHKILTTILSRCQRYDFKRISIDTITERLQELLDREHVEAEPKALSYIAKAADGSMRDALSLLDECIAFFPDQTLSYEGVLDVLGAVDNEVFSRLLSGITTYDAGMVIRIIDEVVSDGRELGQFITDFIWYLRNLLLVKNLDDLEDILDISADNLATMKREVEDIPEEALINDIRVLSNLSNQLRNATQKRVLTEIALLRMCHPEADRSPEALEARVGILERKFEKGIPMAARSSSSAASAEIEEAPKMKELRMAVPDEIEQVITHWDDIRNSPNMMLNQMLSKVRPYISDNNVIELICDQHEDPLYRDYFRDEEKMAELSRIIDERIGAHVEIDFKINDSVYPKEQIYPDAVAAFAKKAGVTVTEEDF
ncbi:MAG: DNA polymerase III subunit gamma/tau, partial [Lachnospiraceae bacterium]|nr:DNA polymerase III subunit gamma/tau [Lachnospiraceae bacterium]